MTKELEKDGATGDKRWVEWLTWKIAVIGSWQWQATSSRHTDSGMGTAIQTEHIDTDRERTDGTVQTEAGAQEGAQIGGQ